MAPDLDERVEAVEVSKVVEIDGKNDMNLSCYKDPPTVGGDCNGIVHEGVKDDGDSSYVFVDGDETVSDDPVEKDPVNVADPSGELELGGEKNVTSSPTEEKQVEIDQSDVVSLLENDVAVDGPETNQGEVEKDDTVKEELDALVKGSEEPEVKSIEADESELGKPDTEITAEKELKLDDETSGLVAEVDESKLPQENDGEEKVQEEALKNSAVNVEEGLNCSQTEAPEGIVKELEEVAGKIQAARQLVQKGCEECPKNEDVWLETCRLSSPDEAKAIIVKGVKTIPKSVKLWMQAAKFEHDDANRSRVLRKGLEQISDSVRLWKVVVELSNEEDARLLLQRAVECCPLHVDLWFALARLETYENAKKVLNKARENLTKEPAIWTKSSDAMEKTDVRDPNVIATVAKLFWHDRKVDKAKNWLERAVTIAPDIGDFWALYYKFELQHGTKESQKDSKED